MSQRNKLSLWQKIKRLLTAAAPQSVIDNTDVQTQPASAKNEADANKPNVDKHNDTISPVTAATDKAESTTSPEATDNTAHDSEHEQSDATSSITGKKHNGATPLV